MRITLGIGERTASSSVVCQWRSRGEMMSLGRYQTQTHLPGLPAFSFVLFCFVLFCFVLFCFEVRVWFEFGRICQICPGDLHYALTECFRNRDGGKIVPRRRWSRGWKTMKPEVLTRQKWKGGWGGGRVSHRILIFKLHWVALTLGWRPWKDKGCDIWSGFSAFSSYVTLISCRSDYRTRTVKQRSPYG